jgi:hypothetical protein
MVETMLLDKIIHDSSFPCAERSGDAYDEHGYLGKE